VAATRPFVLSVADISECEKARSTPEHVAYYDKIGEVANARMAKVLPIRPSPPHLRGLLSSSGGVAVSLTSDIRIASDNCKFGVPAAPSGPWGTAPPHQDP